MRNWNSSISVHPTAKAVGILSYLWGIETCLFSFLVLTSKPDFILPMRNWNKDHRSALCIGFRGFYLTYEELKLLNGSVKSLPSYWILSYLWGIETGGPGIPCHAVSGILSYLWGIETHAVSGNRRNQQLDFILPMRNWNLVSKQTVSTWLVRILSYLWGIETL